MEHQFEETLFEAPRHRPRRGFLLMGTFIDGHRPNTLDAGRPWPHH
jgi:hypothetical protein